MYRTISSSLAIMLGFSSAAAAEVKPGTFVCKSTQAVGFQRGQDGSTWSPMTTEAWKPVNFIMTIEYDPNTDGGQDIMGKKLLAYRITITTKTSETPMECKDTLLADLGKPNNRFVFHHDEFGCKADKNYDISLETMRFTTTTPVGYIWGDEQKISGPVTYIGECAPF